MLLMMETEFMEYFEVQTSSGQIMRGAIDLPNKKAILAVLVVAYGLNGNRIDLNRILVRLGRESMSANLCVIRFDYVGVGLSDGFFCESDLYLRVKNILAISDYAYNRFHVPISLLGFSDGAQVVTLAATKRPYFDKFIYWSPVLLVDHSKKGGIVRFQRDKRFGKIVYPFMGNWMSKEYCEQRNATAYSDILCAQKEHGIYIFWAENDDNVIATQRLLKQYNLGYYYAKTIKGADHCFTYGNTGQTIIEETIAIFCSNV